MIGCHIGNSCEFDGHLFMSKYDGIRNCKANSFKLKDLSEKHTHQKVVNIKTML